MAVSEETKDMGSKPFLFCFNFFLFLFFFVFWKTNKEAGFIMCITLNFLGCGSEEAYWHNRGLEPYRTNL